LCDVDFLLSNNHINQLIRYKFDFSDEELLAYYISFLKTLSLKLNIGTIQFFYNDVCLALLHHHTMRLGFDGLPPLFSLCLFSLCLSLSLSLTLSAS
jgi:hypothetical protein